MSILNQISVGDIIYYTVDDIPTHTAPKGSVAIIDESSPYDKSFIYTNNDGDSTWLKCISPSYGEIQLTDATNEIDFNAQTIGSWYAFNAAPAGATWGLNSNSTDDWILANENSSLDDLKYTGDTTMRVIMDCSTTMRGGTKWMNWRYTPAINFSVLTLLLSEGFTTAGDALVNANVHRVDEINTDDYILTAISPESIEGGGGSPTTRDYIPKHSQVNVVKIDEPLSQTNILIEEGWESSGFTENSWTVANDPSDNVWVVGQATSQIGGISSAYITTFASSGASATYVGDGTDSISSIHKDFTFMETPVNGTLVITLTFDWGCDGSNTDFGCVIMESTGATVTGGVRNTTSVATAGGNGRVGGDGGAAGAFNSTYNPTAASAFVTETIDLSAYAGETKKLIFEWFNNAATDTPPAFILDDIQILQEIITY